MIFDREYLDRITDRLPIDVYLSGNDGARAYWPWRMQPQDEASDRYAAHCNHYIVDSQFRDDSITNTDVLETAHERGAYAAALADVYHDVDGTVEALRDGLALAREHAYGGRLLLPLQAPHDECYDRIQDLVRDDDLLALGGLKDSTLPPRETAVRRLRDAAGADAHIHGLGWSPRSIAVLIRENPALVDSIDYSTPIQKSNNMDVAPTHERASTTTLHAAGYLIEDCRLLIPEFVPELPPELRETTRATTLGAYEGVAPDGGISE